MRFPTSLHRFCVAAVSLTLSGVGTLALSEEGHLSFPGTTTGSVVLHGMDEPASGSDPEDMFQVFVGTTDQCCEGRSPMAGTYAAIADGWRFVPQFEFSEGQPYVVRIEGDLTEFEIASGETEAMAPRVIAIYPNGPEIPENTLRFYIHFSEPMKPHVAFDYIQLVDVSGIVDEAAFMHFKQELWSGDRRRLTVLMDPGRIKRGVSQNVSLGPALEQGQQYSIVVGDGWPSVTNGTAIDRFEHPFGVSEPLRTLPDINEWRIQPPTSGSRDALKIVFDRPYDSAQLHSAITLWGPDGEHIEGSIDIPKGERAWQFTPDNPWLGNLIIVAVNPSLEDVAGNNFRELLDHALGSPEANVDDLRLQVTLVGPNSSN